VRGVNCGESACFAGFAGSSVMLSARPMEGAS
jgi:hypothetical protein